MEAQRVSDLAKFTADKVNSQVFNPENVACVTLLHSLHL